MGGELGEVNGVLRDLGMEEIVPCGVGLWCCGVLEMLADVQSFVRLSILLEAKRPGRERHPSLTI